MSMDRDEKIRLAKKKLGKFQQKRLPHPVNPSEPTETNDTSNPPQQEYVLPSFVPKPPSPAKEIPVPESLPVNASPPPRTKSSEQSQQRQEQPTQGLIGGFLSAVNSYVNSALNEVNDEQSGQQEVEDRKSDSDHETVALQAMSPAPAPVKPPSFRDGQTENTYDDRMNVGLPSPHETAFVNGDASHNVHLMGSPFTAHPGPSHVRGISFSEPQSAQGPPQDAGSDAWYSNWMGQINKLGTGMPAVAEDPSQSSEKDKTDMDSMDENIPLNSTEGSTAFDQLFNQFELPADPIPLSQQSANEAQESTLAQSNTDDELDHLVQSISVSKGLSFAFNTDHSHIAAQPDLIHAVERQQAASPTLSMPRLPSVASPVAPSMMPEQTMYQDASDLFGGQTQYLDTTQTYDADPNYYGYSEYQQNVYYADHSAYDPQQYASDPNQAYAYYQNYYPEPMQPQPEPQQKSPISVSDRIKLEEEKAQMEKTRMAQQIEEQRLKRMSEQLEADRAKYTNDERDLMDRKRKVDSLERQVNEKMAQLDTRERFISEREQNWQNSMRTLQQEKEALSKKKEELHAKTLQNTSENQRLVKIKSDLDQLQSALATREYKVKEEEKYLQERESGLARKEQFLKELETDLHSKDSTLKEKETRLQHMVGSVELKEKTLKKEYDMIETKRKAADDKMKSLQEKQVAIDSEQQRLQTLSHQLERDRHQVELERQQVNEREKRIREHSHKMMSSEGAEASKLTLLRQQIDAERKTLEQERAMLHQKEQQVRMAEENLSKNRVSQSQDSWQLDTLKQDLEKRVSVVKEKEVKLGELFKQCQTKQKELDQSTASINQAKESIKQEKQQLQQRAAQMDSDRQKMKEMLQKQMKGHSADALKSLVADEYLDRLRQKDLEIRSIHDSYQGKIRALEDKVFSLKKRSVENLNTKTPQPMDQPALAASVAKSSDKDIQDLMNVILALTNTNQNLSRQLESINSNMSVQVDSPQAANGAMEDRFSQIMRNARMTPVNPTPMRHVPSNQPGVHEHMHDGGSRFVSRQPSRNSVRAYSVASEAHPMPQHPMSMHMGEDGHYHHSEPYARPASQVSYSMASHAGSYAPSMTQTNKYPRPRVTSYKQNMSVKMPTSTTADSLRPMSSRATMLRTPTAGYSHLPSTSHGPGEPGGLTKSSTMEGISYYGRGMQRDMMPVHLEEPMYEDAGRYLPDSASIPEVPVLKSPVARMAESHDGSSGTTVDARVLRRVDQIRQAVRQKLDGGASVASSSFRDVEH